jgi:hypothetical protein
MSRLECRYCVAYSGVGLPLKLVDALEKAAIANRDAYSRAWFNGEGRMALCEKVVYGDVALQHRYEYHDNSNPARAEITEADEEPRVIRFDEHGCAQV